ncbi:uroporphyrinogen-III C-methyltransferase [Yersinia pseudotuberculosis IP 32953]|uniref:Siroheme synthase 1 n=2 Tax=Yersinia pseudotuberculosis TaxID=633 RepID=CYSG1_YERPS|nr:siroheme synthase CysG [Yersinia pseudotuberculosis]Q66EC9.1 RecName: Full=Siroheme synthase 1; Includes: RecName: Full=Uroporphyrinogen-III C-methyltransferase 1; Short=Urogen III methylase 1; AltName: Full=SUMT 1; AltName: Full=Uroporphyrinogen III methylase 1; Short=UROM 1; Includes: RecName: Full=Precorrin-2 dehydrogenase 1; Includes: RecName: Full=Sirohydrochlorin ferrochelatase 1 [Yersinia pseudotuberculosis IP 32953]AIN13078.1 uroporphyrinogen-III C-methyltransferase [Yersinia pseudotub
MDYLPLFADLKQRPVLIVGGGEVAARKIELLHRAGAQVWVVAQTLSSELEQQYQDGRIHWLAQDFLPEQLDNVFLVIAATNDTVLNAAVFAAADQRCILANVVDDQPLCSFIFPSIVDRSPLVVAISSSGQAPVLARILREKLEALLPTRLSDMAAIAGRWRGRVKQHMASMGERRRFWEHAFSGRFASLISRGQLTEAENELQLSLEGQHRALGEVALVGAGPGDAGLLTLRGLQVMQQADVVLYDHLVSPEVLDLVRRDAERICVGKRAGAHSVTQEATNQLLVTLAQQGKRVVRLKGGDPFIFGRGGEELQVVAQAGIPFQVVPGVTAAAGATAYAGIPLTHRDHAQSVTFITGHCRPDGDDLDWQALARGRQTLAIYMGTVKAAAISQQLIAHGRSSTTPVAVIGRGTRVDQQVLIGTLAQLESLAQQAPTPALLVIGEVVNLHHQIAWFGQQPQTESAISPSVVNLA